ncbi:hypothetical protein ACFXOD_38395 [Streptomyces sp. NPDC059161]
MKRNSLPVSALAEVEVLNESFIVRAQALLSSVSETEQSSRF